MDFDEEDVRAVYRFLSHEHETEIRYLKPAPDSIFVHSEDTFVEVCRRLNGTSNVYVGINERAPNCTKDEDVVVVRAVVLDIDPIRAEGYDKDAATDEEMMSAEVVANSIIDLVRSSGWPVPSKCMSGNGYQLWFGVPPFKIHKDNWKFINEKIKDFNREIAKDFQTDDVKIDNIGNLSRIIKVIGTTSIKGNNTPERPFRLSEACGDFTRIENHRLWNHIMNIAHETPIAVERDLNTARVENKIIAQLIDVNPTLRRYYYEGVLGDRSKTDFILACKLLECNVPRPTIYEILMTRPNGKAQTHKKPDWYVNYTIDKALERTGYGRRRD